MLFDMSFSDKLGIGAAMLTVLLLVLDKAGKLKGPMLLILLGIPALMAVPLALNNSWVESATSGMLKFGRGALLICIVGVVYSLIAIWISPQSTKGATPSPDDEISTEQIKPQPPKDTPTEPNKSTNVEAAPKANENKTETTVHLKPSDCPPDTGICLLANGATLNDVKVRNFSKGIISAGERTTMTHTQVFGRPENSDPLKSLPPLPAGIPADAPLFNGAMLRSESGADDKNVFVAIYVLLRRTGKPSTAHYFALRISTPKRVVTTIPESADNGDKKSLVAITKSPVESNKYVMGWVRYRISNAALLDELRSNTAAYELRIIDDNNQSTTLTGFPTKLP